MAVNFKGDFLIHNSQGTRKVSTAFVERRSRASVICGYSHRCIAFNVGTCSMGVNGGVPTDSARRHPTAKHVNTRTLQEHSRSGGQKREKSLEPRMDADDTILVRRM